MKASIKFENHMRAEIERLPPERKLTWKGRGKHAWICCPWHPEDSPSLKLNVDSQGDYFSVFNCFGCSESGTWNRLASKLNLKPWGKLDSYDEDIPSIPFKKEKEESLFIEKVKIPPDAFPWPERDMWRTIKGKTVNAVGGLMYVDFKIQEPMLFLPAYLNQRLVGGVRCNLVPAKSGSNYFNTPGPWAKENFLFYDYAKALMNKKPKGKRIMAVGEGPRDALNLLQFGVPCVCNLGAINSWSKTKAILLAALEADKYILGFDGDEAGMAAAENAKMDLKGYDVHTLKFPSKKVIKNGEIKLNKLLDLSDLNKEQCLALYDFSE